MRKLFKPWFLLLALMAIGLFAAAACGDDDDDGGTGTATGTGTPAPTTAGGEVKTDVGVTDTEIKLGQHIVESGNLAAVYAPVAPALTAYFNKINQEDGGVCGREITLTVEDDQYSPSVAREKAQKLVEQDKIAAFVNNLGTPPNTGSAQYINDQEVPDLFIATGVPGFADAATYPWTVLYNPDYISEGQILGTYIDENFSGKTVGILYQNDDFGKSGRDGFKEKFTGSIVEEQSYDSTATDISSQLAVLKAANPDILFVYATPSFTAKVFGYMAQNNWAPQVAESYVNSATTLAALVGGDQGPAAGFEQIAGTISTNYILDPIADATDPAIVEHTRIMGAFGGPDVGSLSVYAQAVAETMVKTLEIACDNGDLTRQGIMDAAESITDFTPSVILPGITVDLSKTDHSALQQLMPVEVQADGTLKNLADAPIAGGG